MIPFTINGNNYLVQFRYRTTNLKHPGLPKRSPVTGIASCVICGTDKKGLPYVAMGTSLCTLQDHWSTPRGRRKAFRDAVASCGLLRDDGLGLLRAFDQRFPEPARKPVVRKPIDNEERLRRIADGEAKHEARWAQLSEQERALKWSLGAARRYVETARRELVEAEERWRKLQEGGSSATKGAPC